nr:SigB/SigF/SigG family RNA polymerase sigma factor [Streptoalloteichus tenebrarius]
MGAAVETDAVEVVAVETVTVETAPATSPTSTDGTSAEATEPAEPVERGEAEDGGRGEYDHLAPVLRELAALAPDDPRRAELRERLVTGFLPVARNLARRFARRGEPEEDLVQVATVGLIHAVDRFEPDRGSDFLSFAIPTISGELRRHFRDGTWAVRMPRRLKELSLAINKANRELSQRLGRAARPSELAEHLGVPMEEVYEGLRAAVAYRADSLDAELVGSDGDGMALADRLGEREVGFDHVEAQQTVGPLLASLPERERTILVLRFFAGMTQTQIAERVGVSQMHVSRLLSRTLAKLREALPDESPPQGT